MLSRIRPSTLLIIKESSCFRLPQSSNIITTKRSIIIKSPYKYIKPINKSFSEQLLKRIWRHGCTNPSKSAIINAFNPAEKLSFKELYLRSFSVATFLHQTNFRHGNCVATVLPNLIDFPAIVLGTGLIGGVTSPASAQLTAKELEVQFKDSKASVIFCADFTLEKVLEASANCPGIKKIICLKSGLLPEGSPEVVLPRNVIPFETIKNLQPDFNGNNKVEINPERDIFLLPYSSGTTGPPKGVMLTHLNWNTMVPNFSSYVTEEVFPYINEGNVVTAADHQLLFLPFYHIFGVGALMVNLFLGTPTVTMVKYDFDKMCKAIQDFKVRMMFIVPPVFLKFKTEKIKYDISSLEMLLLGAAPVSQETMKSIQKRLPHLTKIQQGYGMTEVVMASHANSLKEDYPYASIGRPLPGYEMKIVDPESRKELGYNDIGEVCVKSEQIMLGYLDKPSSTAAMKDDSGWLYTGDIGYFDENEFTYIVDRMKELIKVSGLQVAPAELEALLLTHPKIKDAAVIGIPHEQKGEVPRAYVVISNSDTEDGDDVTEDEIKAFVATKAAPYKQLKGGVEFVKEIPKSPSGKILRRLLRDQFKKRLTLLES